MGIEMFSLRKAAVRIPLPIFRSALLGLLFVLALEGCVSGASDNPFLRSTNMDGYNLRVQSRNLYEVSIYAIILGRRKLIGVIPPNRLQFFDFEFPKGMPLSLELESDVGDRYRIPSVHFISGRRVDLNVANNLRRSGFVTMRQE